VLEEKTEREEWQFQAEEEKTTCHHGNTRPEALERVEAVFPFCPEETLYTLRSLFPSAVDVLTETISVIHRTPPFFLNSIINLIISQIFWVVCIHIHLAVSEYGSKKLELHQGLHQREPFIKGTTIYDSKLNYVIRNFLLTFPLLFGF